MPPALLPVSEAAPAAATTYRRGWLLPAGCLFLLLLLSRWLQPPVPARPGAVVRAGATRPLPLPPLTVAARPL